MRKDLNPPDDSIGDQLHRIDRQIRRDQLRKRIEALGGLVGGPEKEEVSEAELSFFERVLAEEAGPRSSNRDWLARKGFSFVPPAELEGAALNKELWRLIHALAEARVFLHCTNHLSDAELYARLWTEVLPDECGDHGRSENDSYHWDFASADGTEVWLRFYASRTDRENWRREFPDTTIPERRRPPYRRDHQLPPRG